MRKMMVQEILDHSAYARAHAGCDALDPRVLEVMASVPRHVFVPAEIVPYAYLNMPLPIGYGKTISQPFIVALMTDLLDLRPEDTVLEIGTGLGYQSAVCARLAATVYSIEIIAEHSAAAQRILSTLGYGNVALRVGDGALGWAEKAPFDKIIVTAAPELIPPMLLQQLKPGGRMVIPSGLPDSQSLVLVEKDETSRITTRDILAVRFSVLENGDDI